MDRKHRRMIEGNLYVFSLPSGMNEASLTEEIDQVLAAAKCGRILGSGMSLCEDNTVTVEIGAYDRDKANSAISRLCSKLKCRDYEMAWD